MATTTRRRWEDSLFDAAYQTAPDGDRPKYGVLNITLDPNGLQEKCSQYGDSFFLLKQHVRARATFTSEDSGQVARWGQPADGIGTADHYAHVLNQYTDRELRAIIRTATGGALPIASKRVIATYKEVQARPAPITHIFLRPRRVAPALLAVVRWLT